MAKKKKNKQLSMKERWEIDGKQTGKPQFVVIKKKPKKK